MNNKNTAKSVKQKLLNKSKKENIRFNDVLLYYGIERFLYRLSISRHKHSLFLKGALMFLVWKVPGPRPTRDIDFLGQTNNSLENLSNICREICETNCEEDGIQWLPTTIDTVIIQNQKAYSGVRITFRGKLDTAIIPMQIDVSFIDIIYPKPLKLDYPTLLNMPKPQLLGYTPESVIAEKVHTMLDLGKLNSRMKDYFDVWFLSQQFEFDGKKLYRAITKTFTIRKLKFAAIDAEAVFSKNFYHDKNKNAQWKSFLSQNKLEIAPTLLDEVINTIGIFILPIIKTIQSNKEFTGHWNRHTWI